MRKRILALVLSLLLIASVLPVNVSAYSAEGARLTQRITDHYAKILEANEKESLSGYCGALASYQLYYLGVNSYALMANGNDQYDCYLNSNYTSNGYRIKRYPAEDYTLVDALYAITQGGSRDAYNILVCFQQTTTEAGSLYGHAVVIYGIVEGKVYFTESFGTPFFEKEGMPGVCSIYQFAALYEGWTTFEGVVFFGRKGYLDSCDQFNTDMYVKVTEDADMYTLPCPAYANAKCNTHTRCVQEGECLRATALYRNPDGEYYYQIQDEGEICYLFAEYAEPVRFNAEDVNVTDLVIPQALAEGKDFTIGGKISATNSHVKSVKVFVTNAQGQTVLSHSRARIGGTYDLQQDTYNKTIDFGALEPGLYTYTITAEVQSKYYDEGSVEDGYRTAVLCNELFTVGETQLPQEGREVPEAMEDGWNLQDGVWCYYENGAPRTGWMCVNGVDCYLTENGSPAVGWTEINGKMRYFTQTGAMHTGWLKTKEGTYYLLKNGQKAIGWRNIGFERYYFDETGAYVIGWQTIDEKEYFFFADGGMAIGWNELNAGTFYFAEDGQVLAKAIVKGGEVTYEMKTEEPVEIPPLFEEEPEETIEE